MKIYKFIVGSEYVKLPGTDIEVKGIMAATLAETEEQAREIIRGDGWDSRWLDVAEVQSMDLTTPRLIAYAGSFPARRA